MAGLRSITPSFASFDFRNRKTAPQNLIAGVSVALVLIPQSLAYAQIAGLPPEVGLYSAALVPLVSSFFVASPYLQNGPVALTSLMTFGALSGRAMAGSENYIQMAILLAVLIGVMRVAMGLLGGGRITTVLTPEISLGFTTAAAVLILASQLPSALGVTDGSHGILRQAFVATGHPAGWHLGSVGFAAAATAVILLGRRINRLFPGVMLAVVFGAIASGTLGFRGNTIGALPISRLSVATNIPWGDTAALLVPAFAIAVVGFAEPATIAKTYATLDRQPWDADREFVASGVANLASAVVGGMPVGGSFSRTSLGRLTGATTPLASFATGCTVLAFLPFTHLLEDLPTAVLAASVIVAVLSLLRFDQIVGLVRSHRSAGLVASFTLFATLVAAPHIERGVIAGIAFGWLVSALGRRKTVHRFERSRRS